MQFSHDAFLGTDCGYSVLYAVRHRPSPSDMFFADAPHVHNNVNSHRSSVVIDPWAISPATEDRHHASSSIGSGAAAAAAAEHCGGVAAAESASTAAFTLIHDPIPTSSSSACISSYSTSLQFDRTKRDRTTVRRLTEPTLASDTAEESEAYAVQRRFRRPHIIPEHSDRLQLMMNPSLGSRNPRAAEEVTTSAAYDNRSSKAKRCGRFEAGGDDDDDTGPTPAILQPYKRAATISEDVSAAVSSSQHGRRSAAEEEEMEEEKGREDSRSRGNGRWSFGVMATLRAMTSTDVIAAMDFDEAGGLFATGGISRKIRVCSFENLTAAAEEEVMQQQQYHDEAASAIICTPAKLSSLRWRPHQGSVVGCGDYDGVVTEWDVEQGTCVSERDEHGGRRIWSVDYSPYFPFLCASASGDSTVKLWSHGCERNVAVIKPSSAAAQACCAQFAPDSSNTKLAIACADSNIFIYDLRRTDRSLQTLRGHERSASYVRFLSAGELVSASIDSTLRLWKLGDGCGVYRGHRNVKNFVGLSVIEAAGEGLMACGSETNEVFVYERRQWDGPVWRKRLPLLGGEMNSDVFVGAVCWRPAAAASAGGQFLVTANSQGTLQLISVVSQSSSLS